jgi:hypothetical protein
METIEIAMAVFLGIIVIGSVWILVMLHREQRDEEEMIRKHLRK